jgi:ABC-2 type transport system permease protein
MKKNYNQFRAMMAITKGSLRAIFRSPSAVVFSIAFPLIFILVFGFIGGGGRVSVNVAFDKKSDTANPIYTAVKNIAGIKVIRETDSELNQT